MRRRHTDTQAYSNVLNSPFISSEVKKSILERHSVTCRSHKKIVERQENEKKDRETNPLWFEFKEIVENDFKQDERFKKKKPY